MSCAEGDLEGFMQFIRCDLTLLKIARHEFFIDLDDLIDKSAMAFGNR